MAKHIGAVRDDVASRRGANTRTVLAKNRMLCGDGEIAEIGDVVSAANRGSVDTSDHRFWAFDDVAVEVELQSFEPALDTGILLPVDVAADTEGAFTGAGQNDNTDFLVRGCLEDQALHLRNVIAGKGIKGLWPIDGDGRDVVLDVVHDLFFGHDGAPFCFVEIGGRPQPIMVYPPDTDRTWPVT